MQTIQDSTADFLVRALTLRSEQAIAEARHPDLAGEEHQKARSMLEYTAVDARDAIRGLNDGTGVTRSSAMSKPGLVC